jgi:hypothetical protein
MQWHWGNIGSALAGLSTLVIAAAALIRGPAALRDWSARQRAQAEAAREEAEGIRLERRRHLSGWSGNGVDTYGVALVTEAGELAAALGELTGRDAGRSGYVVVRLAEGQQGHDADRAQDLRRLIETEGYISRPPTIGEREALEIGLDAMGIPRAAYGQVRPPQRQGDAAV